MKKPVRIAILVRKNYWLNDAVPGNGSGHRSVPAICQAVEAAGGEAHLVYQEVAGDFDGLILPGGGDLHPQFYGQSMGPHIKAEELDPALDELQLSWAERALRGGRPVLGICRGMQVLNVAAGGTLIQDIPSSGNSLDHAPLAVLRNPTLRGRSAHGIRVGEGSQLRLTLGRDRLAVNSIHHQAVERVGAGLQASAWAEDGIVEAIESKSGAWQVGVQFHPEDMQHRPAFRNLFRRLVENAR